MDPNPPWIKMKLAPVVFFLLALNILFLDLLTVLKLSGKTDKQTSTAAAISIYVTPTSGPTSDTQTDSQDCSPTCKLAIDKAIAPFKLTPTSSPLSQQQQTFQLQSYSTPQPTAASRIENTVREFFIPLGTGSSTAAEWTDVIGVKAEVDSNKYPNIQRVLFEASTHVANANQIVEVRLYNETDKYVVANSEFLYPSGTSQNFRIAEIQLGQGAKTYKVQMKTQLQYTAVLDQARIHITTN